MKALLLWGLLLCCSSSLFAQQKTAVQVPQGLNKMDFFYAGESKALRMYVIKKGNVVWKYENMKPDQGEISDATLMKDGNTLISNWFNQWNGNVDKNNPPVQAIVVSPDKKILYKICSWSNPDLGPSTMIQPLNETVDRTKCFFGKFK
jgi:hypothetical protein